MPSSDCDPLRGGDDEDDAKCYNTIIHIAWRDWQLWRENEKYGSDHYVRDANLHALSVVV